MAAWGSKSIGKRIVSSKIDSANSRAPRFLHRVAGVSCTEQDAGRSPQSVSRARGGDGGRPLGAEAGPQSATQAREANGRTGRVSRGAKVRGQERSVNIQDRHSSFKVESAERRPKKASSGDLSSVLVVSVKSNSDQPVPQAPTPGLSPTRHGDLGRTAEEHGGSGGAAFVVIQKQSPPPVSRCRKRRRPPPTGVTHIVTGTAKLRGVASRAPPHPGKSRRREFMSGSRDRPAS
ncbi:unnamed protein product [Lampetra fluviatilis]